MQTLFDKVNQGNINQLDALDITLSLCYHIEDCSGFSHLDPYVIGLDEDNNVTILQEERPVDCFYSAPDVVLEGAAASRDSMQFSLGCLLFFMLNGKSYCEAYNLDPIDIADTKPGNSQVDPNTYSGRASDVICALTSWAPEKRSEGMVKLLQIVENAPANVTLQYTLNGQIVHTEQIDIHETIHNYRSGEIVTSDDHAAYAILPGATVRFRPGYHTATIPVARTSATSAQGSAASGSTGGTKTSWLIMTFPNPDEPDRPIVLRVLPMNDEPQNKFIPISLLQKTRYQFVAMAFDSQNRPVGKKEMFYLDIPAVQQIKRAFMSIRYHVNPKGFSVVLCDQTRKPLSNTRHFKMN